MEENYNHLEWDTDCFGFGVARIIKAKLDETELSEILRILRDKGYRMVYWYVPAELNEISRIADAGCPDDGCAWRLRPGLIRDQALNQGHLAGFGNS